MKFEKKETINEEQAFKENFGLYMEKIKENMANKVLVSISSADKFFTSFKNNPELEINRAIEGFTNSAFNKGDFIEEDLKLYSPYVEEEIENLISEIENDTKDSFTKNFYCINYWLNFGDLPESESKLSPTAEGNKNFISENKEGYISIIMKDFAKTGLLADVNRYSLSLENLSFLKDIADKLTDELYLALESKDNDD